MAAERFYGYGNSPNGTNFTARIYDIDHVGSSTEFYLAQGGIQITWDSKETDNRHAPIMGSTCALNMLIPVGDATLEAFIDEVRTAKEGQFWVEIVSGGTPDVRWRGILTGDASNEVDEAGLFRCTISAVCGLAMLREVPYHSGTAIYEGQSTLVLHLSRAIKKLSHADLWGASDAFIETSVDWWAETMTTGGANDALFQARVDAAAWYDFHSKGALDKDVLSCYDVIADIATSFGGRIFQMDGVFRLEQVDYRINPSYSYRQYDKSGNFVTSGTHTGVNTVNQTAISGAKVSFVEYDYLPQISKAEVTYECNLRRNFWQGIVLQNAVAANFNAEIDSNSGAATLHLKWSQINVTIKNNSYSGNPADIIFAEIGLTVKVGSNYLKRGGTYSNFTYHPGAMEWTTNAADKVIIVVPIGQVPPSGITGSGIVGFDVITPALPSDGSANSITATFQQLRRNNNESVTSSEFTVNWNAQGIWLSAYDDGTPDALEDQIFYETVNPDDGTFVWEENIRLGGGSPNYLGKLTRSDNYAFQQWEQGTGGQNTPLGALLSEVVVNGQLRPIKRLNGTIYGESINPRKLLSTTDSIDWLAMRMRWSPLESVIDGSWFELDYGATGVPSTPIKIKVLTGGNTKIPFISGPVTPFPTGNGNQGFASNSPATVLAPIAFNTLATPIAEGDTITSIDVEDALLGNEFLVGDLVTLAHPITGQYQDFTVSSPPAAAATAIAVTSVAADFAAPVGSFLVIKQKAYAFSLPDADSGDILRFDGTEWAIYQGVTDGHVLTWDTTNGWQAEVAPGGGLADGDKGDITVTSSGATWTIDDSVVTDTKLRDSAGYSVIGRGGSTTGAVADITAGADAQILVRTGGALTFGQAETGSILDGAITTAKISNNEVTLAKVQQIATDRLLGRDTAGTGDVEQISLNSTLSFTGAGAIQRAALTGDVTATAGSNATTIANDAVTYAKMQNVVNNNRILGNVGGAGGIVTELTAAQVQTLLSYVDGTGAANRMAYWSDADTITSNAAYTVDATNGRMKIIGVTAGLGATSGYLYVNVPSVSSTMAFAVSGAGNANINSGFENTSNSSTNQNSIVYISTGGSSAGDPTLQFAINGASNVAMGLDNSDSDKFKITMGQSLPGQTANNGIIITQDATPKVGINKDSPKHPLDVSGVTRSNQFVGNVNEWLTSDLVPGTGMGTGGTINSITGTGNDFTVVFTTGTTPTADGTIFTCTYPTAFTFSSYVNFSAGSATSASEYTKFYRASTSNSDFVFKANGTLTASTQYIMDFHIGGSSNA